MRYALTHPDYGYYMKKDVFGTKGDFTTSPEISQMFGELIGLWCMSMWEKLGEPVDLQIVEVGPGRGTLMKDMFSTWYRYKDFLSSIHINFVEVSPHLRKMQAQSLGISYPDSKKEDKPIIDLDSMVKMVGDLSKAQSVGSSAEGNSLQRGQTQDGESTVHVEGLRDPLANNVDSDVVTLKTVQGVSVSWHETISTVGDGPILYICQEFFDALPIRQYVFRDGKWREKIIAIDHGEGEHWFKFQLSGAETLASSALESTYKFPKEEDCIETSPDSFIVGKEMSSRIAKEGGAALIIDYGHDRPSQDSLRGIKDHKFVNVLMEPGEVDLSAFVDFAALKTSFHSEEIHKDDIEEVKNLTSLGPIPQGDFLVNLGIDARLAKLIRKCKNDEEVDLLISSFKRLVDEDQMGEVYKVLTVSNLPNEGDIPDGFIKGVAKEERTQTIKIANGGT